MTIRRNRWIAFVAIYALLTGHLFGNTSVTTISRLKLDHPDLGYDGGAALHTAVANLYQKIGDNMNSRYVEYTSVANSTTSTFEHNFGAALSEIVVRLYTGTGNSKVRIPNPTAAGWTIVATPSFLTTKVDITTPSSGGPFTFSALIVHGRGSTEKLDDLDDVDVTTSSPQDGQALVYDLTSTQWLPGASGDSSLKCQSITTPNLVLKSGYLILDDSSEIQVASDLTVSLTTILGSSPANATAYYLYIDRDALPSSSTLTNGRKVKVASTASHFSLQTATPDTVLLSRYIPLCVIKSATTGTAWSGSGSAFATLATRRHDRPSVNVSPTVYELAKQTVGAVGSTGQVQAGHVLDANSFNWTFADDIAFYNLDSVSDNSAATSCSSGAAACTLTNNGTATFGGTGILGATTTLSLNGSTQYLSSTDAFFNPGGTFFTAMWVKSASATSQGLFYGWTSLSNRNFAIDFQGNIACIDYAINQTAEAATAAASSLRYCPTTSPLSNWHHIAMGYDGTYAKFYYDGVLVHQYAQTSVNTAASGAALRLGTDFQATNFFNGQIDEFVFARHSFTDADIKKLYSYRFDHNKNVSAENQKFSATFYDANEKIVNEMNDFVVAKTANSVYADFGLASTDKVSMRMQNQSFTTTMVPIYTFTTGKLTAAPSFPLAHGLGTIPKDFYVLTTGQSLSGLDDKRYDLCSADSTNINCDLSSLTIDSSHKIEVVASAAPIAISVPAADATTVGTVTTGTQSFGGDKTFTGNLISSKKITSNQSVSNDDSISIINTASTSGQSFGLNILAGTTSADYIARFATQSGSTSGKFQGDGLFVVNLDAQVGPHTAAASKLTVKAASTSLNNAIEFNDSSATRFYINHINNATAGSQTMKFGSVANGDALTIDAVGTGIKLPTSGGTAADLNSYEEFTHTTTFNLSGTANNSSSVSIHITKIGKLVTLCGPPVQVTGAAGASSSIDMNTAIPTRFRPNFVFLIPGSRVLLSGTTQSAPGSIVTGTNGVVSIFVNFANPATNWGTSGTNGFQNDWCASYNQQ